MAKKKNYELEILISGGTDASLAASIQKARRELGSLERRAGISAGNIGDSFGGMSVKGIDALGNAADKVFGTMLKGAKMAAVGGAAILGASTAVGMGFESQMSAVQAISQSSEGDMGRLTALAKEMGETTQFSAEEAGQGLEYMAMAGWKAGQMVNGLPGIMNLAAASGEELGTVSDIVTDALTAFGLKAEDSAMFADVLAQASSNSNTNVAMMGETFKYVAPVAGSFGYDVKDAALAIGLMANAGIKSSQAGTSLRRILLELGSGAKLTGKAFGEMNIETANADGSMRPLKDVLKDLRKGFALMTEEERAANAEAIAGKTGVAGLLSVVNAGEDDFNELSEAIEYSEGAAERMAKIRLDNLSGDLTLLKSASQGLGIEIYGGMSGGLRGLAQAATGWVASFTGGIKEGMPTIQRQVKQFGAAMKKGLQPVIDFGGWCLEHPDVVKGTIMGIVAAFGTFKAVQAAKNGVALLGTLSGMISAWPVAAAGLAVGAIVGIAAAVKDAERSAAKANLEDHFGRIALSIEDLDEAARHIVSNGGNLFDQLDSFSDASEKVQELERSLASGLREIQKADWKLSLGITFDEGDKDSYVSAVESYVKNAQDYITNSGYEMKLAIGVVFGEGDAAGKELENGSNDFYQSLYDDLKPLQSGLQTALKHIAEEGLSLPRQEIVDSYLKDISEITSMIAEAENSAELQMLKNQYAGADMLTGDTFQSLQMSIQEYTDKATEGIDDSYKKILTSLNAQRIAGEQGMEGGISQEEFEVKSADALAAYYEQKAQVIQNGYQVMKDAILSTYGDEIEPALEAMNQQIQEGLPHLMETSTTPESFITGFDKLITDSIEAAGMDSDAKGAVMMLMEGMLPTQEDMEQLKRQMIASGVNPSETITDALDDMTEITAVTGDKDSIWRLIGDSIADNEDYALLISTVSQQTGQVPDIVIQEISSKNDEIETEARTILEVIRNTFADGVQAEIPITLNTVTQYRNGALAGTGKIPHYAKGGLIERPTLSWFAEDSPEMAIPINGSQRSVELWQEAGAMLGAYDTGNYDRMTSSLTAGTEAEGGRGQAQLPAFSPTINLSGGDGNAREQVAAALDEGYERWVELMERYQREQFRVAF